MPRFSYFKEQTASLLVLLLAALVLLSCSLRTAAAVAPGDNEFTGKLDAALVPNAEDLDQVIFKPIHDLSNIKVASPPEASDTVTAARIYSPPLDRSAILTLLVEPEDGVPYIYADVDMNGALSASERFELKHGEDDNPYIWETTVRLPMTGTMFESFPVFIQYYKNVKWDEMQDDERLVLQSKEAFAKGKVEIQGRQTVVEYGFNPKSKKITVMNGWLGVDGDGDGLIDMDRFSPEAAEAREEMVIFRVGDAYVSTKRVDVEKNLIVMRSHTASDYKRVELRVGSEVPDFNFTDFNGKKRKLSEFRGKYVLVDFWAAWCGPCRRELPYLRVAYTRFQSRGFEILGMNNDDDPVQVKSWLAKNNLTWTQATMDSIHDVEVRYRVHLFPSTLLLGPDGKIISLNQRKKNQPSLRGADLLKSLDQLLPQ